METLTKHFESRVGAFLERTRLKPSTFGLRATGDPNLIRQLRLGRSPTLATADRILEFIETYDGDQADRVPSRSDPLPDASIRERRERTTEAIPREMDIPAPILGLPGVEARTGLSQSKIYLQVAEGSFPEPVRAVVWIEEDVDAWIRKEIEASRGRAQGPMRPPES